MQGQGSRTERQGDRQVAERRETGRIAKPNVRTAVPNARVTGKRNKGIGRKPARDRREENTGKRQDRRENYDGDYLKARGIQENRQDFIDDELDDWYDDYGYHGGYYASHIYVSMPCTYTVVQVGNVTYYQCGSVWYNQVYNQGDGKLR